MSETAKKISLLFESMSMQEKALAVILVKQCLESWRQNKEAAVRTITLQKKLLELMLEANAAGDFLKDVEDGIVNGCWELLGCMRKDVGSVVS